VAATALFLANKTEENCFKTKNLIIAVAKVAQKNPKLIIDEQSKEYWRWRDSILMHEELMLEILTFDLMISNPYEQLWNHLDKLDLLRCKPLREAAWTFLNDSALTILPLLMDARDLAMASVFFASNVAKVPIVDRNGDSWWKDLNANEDRVVKAIDVIDGFYRENPLKKQDQRVNGSPEFTLESTRRRGETILSQTEAGSSRGGTPMDTEKDTQSPRNRVNGRGREDEGIENSNGKDDGGVHVPPEAHGTRGDSDAALKAATNDLDYHKGKPIGKDNRSPGIKRKTVEADLMSEQGQQKRPRQTGGDDGEVRESGG
jgi:protein BUR2